MLPQCDIITLQTIVTAAAAEQGTRNIAMASQNSLYTLTPETKASLRKFRLSSSRAKTPQAQIYFIDRSTLCITQDAEADVLTSLETIAEAVPDHQPRFILLSYPYETDDGRFTAPYLLLHYLPPTCNSEMRMLYAGAKEVIRREAEANRVLEVEGEDEILEIEEKIKG